MLEPTRQISSIPQLIFRLNNIASQALSLGEVVVGYKMPIDTLTLFSQTDDEFNRVAKIIRTLGTESDVSHGRTLYVNPAKLQVRGFGIKYLGVRQPDETRTELGYADYPVNNFAELSEIAQNHPFMTNMESGRGEKLIELRHHDYSVRGYIADSSSH